MEPETNTVAWLISMIGLGAIGGAGWLIRKQFSRLFQHLDDSRRHLDPSNRYVREAVCDARYQSVWQQYEQQRSQITEITQRIDELMQQHSKATEAILKAIAERR